MVKVNRTQALVLGFFLVAWVSLLAILMAAPEVYDQALSLPGAGGAAEIAFLAALTGFITLLAVSVVRRWRWAFWLILVAFLAGVLRVPVAILQLTGALPVDTPTWYVAFQGLIGLAQLAIGLAMLAGYRRSGVWGPSDGERGPPHAGVVATRETPRAAVTDPQLSGWCGTGLAGARLGGEDRREVRAAFGIGEGQDLVTAAQGG
jgi:hypothetical protein